MLRSVTFWRKESWFQKSGSRSRRIFLPIWGALGRRSSAGALFSSFRQESQVLPRIPAMEARSVAAARTGLNRYFSGAKLYIEE